MSSLSIFQFESREIRVILIDGEPWFVAKDVCEILEIDDTSKACSRLKDYEKLTRTLFVSGQNRDVLVVSESGLYRLVLTSRKPQAEPFQDWVCQEVIPSIRKSGSYSIKQEVPTQLPSYEVAEKTANAIVTIQEKLAFTQPRLAQFLIEAAMNDVNKMMALPQSDPNEDTLMTCEAWGNENGFKVTKLNRSSLGRFVAKLWREEMKSEPLTQKQECGGALRNIKVYPVSFLVRVVPQYFS